jgi:hypothetical protein
VIRVDKSNPPQEVAERCGKLTEELRRVYAGLLEIYAKKDPGQPVTMTAADQDALILEILATKATDKTRATLLKQLPSFVFQEEIVEDLATKTPPQSDQDFQQLRPEWDKQFLTLVGAYSDIRSGARALWGPAVDQLLASTDASTRAAIAERIALYYQRRALRSTRPFRTLIQARQPDWFEPFQLRSWKAFSDIPHGPTPEQSAPWFARYQQVLDTVRIGVLSGQTPWLAPTAWMVPDDHATPDGDTLFAYVKSVYRTRVEQRRPMDLSMTAREMAELREPLRGREHQLVFHFLAVRALGQVLETYLEPKKVLRRRPLIGFKSETFDSGFYSGHGIKEALMTSHFGKCAFCEGKVRALAHGDVEHFRPKAGYDQGHRFNYDGYFWRAYDWTNLYFSCQICNQVNKDNHFPVLLDTEQKERRQSYDRYDRPEQPVLVDPGAEDPRACIRFDPRTGRAYPYDMLHAYLERAGVGDRTVYENIANVESLIWSDPSVIPDLTGTTGVITVDDLLHVTPRRFADLYYQVPDLLHRGTRTIQILGLNRTELVARRVQHLRALRGLVTTAANALSPEQADAQQALLAATLPSAEFSSLAIDALNTWQAGAAYPWLKRYNEILAKAPVYEYEPADFEAKDVPIMYVIKDLNQAAAVRQLAYLKGDLEIDDPNLPTGWYLQVPDEDDNLTVTVTRHGKTVQTLTVQELFELKQPWHKFKDNAVVTVAGPFSTVISFS